MEKRLPRKPPSAITTVELRWGEPTAHSPSLSLCGTYHKSSIRLEKGGENTGEEKGQEMDKAFPHQHFPRTWHIVNVQ